MSGIPVFWQQGPEPLSAGLVFGVGRRDEDFVRGGITHLLEHAVMHEVTTPTLECNASVSLSFTEFTVTGRPERAAAFLRSVCELLTDPPVHRLAVEAGVLQAEGCDPGPLAYALGKRYGLRGAGRAAVIDPALLALTAEQVRAWAAEYFTAANAALWLTGPVPDGLELPLPAGRPPVRPNAEQTGIPVPGWAEHYFDEVVAAAELPRGAAPACLAGILRQRVEDELRHRRGLTYAVYLDSEIIDDERRHVGILVQVRPGAVQEAVNAIVGLLNQLACDGPTGQELADYCEGIAELLDDPRAVPDKVQGAAEAHVRHWRYPDDATLLADARAITAEQIREQARQMRRSLLVGVPEGTELHLPGTHELPPGSTVEVTGRVFRRRLMGGAPRGMRLVVGDDGAMIWASDECKWTVRWEDAVGLIDEGNGLFVLMGADGWLVPLKASEWRQGDEALRYVRQRVAAELCVKADPVPDDETGLVGERSRWFR